MLRLAPPAELDLPALRVYTYVPVTQSIMSRLVADDADMAKASKAKGTDQDKGKDTKADATQEGNEKERAKDRDKAKGKEPTAPSVEVKGEAKTGDKKRKRDDDDEDEEALEAGDDGEDLDEEDEEEEEEDETKDALAQLDKLEKADMANKKDKTKKSKGKAKAKPKPDGKKKRAFFGAETRDPRRPIDCSDDPEPQGLRCKVVSTVLMALVQLIMHVHEFFGIARVTSLRVVIAAMSQLSIHNRPIRIVFRTQPV